MHGAEAQEGAACDPTMEEQSQHGIAKLASHAFIPGDRAGSHGAG